MDIYTYLDVKGKHPRYIQEMQNWMDSGKGSLKQLDIRACVDAKTHNIFGWLDWIVSEGLSFNFCSNDLTTAYSRLKSICPNTLKKLFSVEVEKKMSNSLSQKFGIIFDGWIDSSSHYVGVSACFPDVDSPMKAKTPLLAFAPLLDEVSRLSSKPMVGCASHRFNFNLAIKKYLQERNYSVALDNVQEII